MKWKVRGIRYRSMSGADYVTVTVRADTRARAISAAAKKIGIPRDGILSAKKER